MSKNYDKQSIIARYQEMPVSIKQIANEFNLCSTTVSRLLKKFNIPIWTKQDLYQGDLEVDFFKVIDTEPKAYLLGLFAADGCVYTGNNGKLFTIQLQSKDAYMVEYAKTKIKAPRSIVVDKRDGSLSLSVINDKFVNNLINNGVTEGKATRFLPNISERFMPHFIRGLLDGDGSILIKKSHAYGVAMKCTVVLLAHHKMITQLQTYLEEKLNLSHLSLNYDGGTAYSIRYTRHSDVLALMNYLYNDAHLYLWRKFQNYRQALEFLS